MDEQTTIIAVVTNKPENVKGGGAPVFICENNQELQEISNSLGKTLDASVHEVSQNTMIVVKR